MSRRDLQPAKPKLRKREIALAVGAGLVAASGAAIVLDEIRDDSRHEVVRIERSDAGEETSRTYDLADFDEITSVGPQDIVVTYGEEFSVRGEGPSGELSDLEVTTEGGSLVIKPKGEFNFDFGDGSSATFYVTLPKLDKVTLTGSGDMTVDRIEGDSFEAVIAGSGELQLAGITVDRADFTLAGAGSLTAAGTARATKVSIGGAGEFDAGALKSETADISIAGAGDVEMDVSGAADISIMGAGDVEITGTDQCTVSRMGAGDVTCNGREIGN